MVQKKTVIAAVNIFLLLSLHVPPAGAVRTHASEEAEKAGDFDQELAEIVEQSLNEDQEEDDHADSGGGEEEGGGSLIEAAEDSEEEAMLQTGCWGSKTMRWFHFELNRTGVGQYAVEFIRSPREPRMVLYPNKGWAVKATGDDDMPLDWVLYDTPGHLEQEVIMIDVSYDVKWIRKLVKSEGPPGLEFVFKRSADGPGKLETFEFTGGIYYPEKLLGRQVNRQAKEREGHHAQDKIPSVSYTGSAVAEGAAALGSKVKKWTGSFALQGGGYGLLVGFGLSYGFSTAVMLMNAALNSFLASIGVATTVQISIGIAPLTVSQVLSFTASAGTLGLMAGTGIGLAIGLVAGIAVAVPRMIHEWTKQRREFRLSASEKLFNKLKCHRKISRCHRDTLLVPGNGRCPSKKEVTEALDWE